jgi:hypothetical protein
MVMNKITVIIILIIGMFLVGWVIFDRAFAVRSEMPIGREGEPQPTRPQPGDEPFHTEPIALTFEARRQLYYEWALTQPTADDRGGVWTDIVKLAAGAESINPVSLQAALDFVNNREDPSDFYLTALIRLYCFNHGNGKLTPDQEAAIEAAILNTKYWLDQPGTTYVEMWTENHQILNHSAEYLAGQLFPDRGFSNSGETGSWHQQHAESLILQWIDLRARTGFAEWDSETYYPEDLAPLLNLVDFAQDPDIAQRAAMLVDLILFDIAVDSFHGHYATSHGRVTAGSIQSADTSMATIIALAWGQAKFTTTSNMGAVALATTPKYRVPPVIQSLALDNPEEYFNYERHSFDLDEAAAWGLDITNVNNAPRFWGMGAFTRPEVINLTLQTADEWELWHYPDFKDLKDIAKILQKLHAAPLASRLLDPDPNGVLMNEVNKVTYRTPDYQLSSAQSFRPGEKGYQQHIWQATLGPYAVVFTTNPDSLRADDKHRPSYWMANGRQPRTGQFKNVLIALYDIPRYPSAPPPLEARHYTFTHAYFPRWAFDEVVERDGWIFGHAGDGFVALYSHEPYEWVTEGLDANQEVVALNRKNVWIVQLGRKSVDGSFDDFMDAVSAAPLAISDFKVEYQAPNLGLVAFDWVGALTLDGEEIPLDDYPRWDNPYTQADFGSTQYMIEYQGQQLFLDFVSAAREYTK